MDFVCLPKIKMHKEVSLSTLEHMMINKET